jgi:OOP family OmpA-OmpF porin
MRIKLLSTIALLAAATTVNAQGKYADRFTTDKKGSFIGFNVNNASYQTKDFYPGFIPNVNQSNIGADIKYWQGITKHLDFAARLGTIFTDYDKENMHAEGVFHPELDLTLNLKALKENHLFNPFISAGIGAGRYSKTFVPYAPVGVGLQINLFEQVYIMSQASYRVSLNEEKMDNSMLYSLGVIVPIKLANSEPKVKAPKDTDGDGVPDSEDMCPDVPGLVALNGCPDADGDGIADKDDKCPTVAGTAKYNGCPIPDTDGDGINDEEDKCPNEPGTAKYGGCPIPDTDGDGINDEEDRCPTVAGPRNNHGCPFVNEQTKVKLKEISKGIYFETGKDVLKNESLVVLDQIVDIMNEYNAYIISIEGHTDNTGKADKNLALSKDRAKAVHDYLASKGIQESRMEYEGYGQEKPIADNKTAAGRAKNRRVELELKMK